MSTLTRTFRNLWRVGPRNAWHQLNYIGDTKAGTLIAQDKFGNKYYENLEEELPLRTRWVDYAEKEFDPSQIEPGWHAWMSYMTHDPPTLDPIAQARVRAWEPRDHKPNQTLSRAAYKPYSTVKSKITPWLPRAEPRS